MVAKSPTSTNRVKTSAGPNPTKEIVQKVERCMARLQKLQLTVTGGKKINSPLKLSPSRNKGYHRSSLNCNQESLRKKSVTSPRSLAVKIHGGGEVQEWRTMSLWTMLLNETITEIMQASKLVSKIKDSSTAADPRTPETVCRRRNPPSGNTELRTRRANEKKLLSRILRSESGSPGLRSSRTRIKFKATSPLCKKNAMSIPVARPPFAVNRIPPKTRQWTKKTVLFPNPLFLPTSLSSIHQKKYSKNRSPIITKTLQAPHKFLIKSPRATLGLQFKNNNAVTNVTVSPIKDNGFASKPRRSSFSPSKFANRLISPLKARLSLHRRGSSNAIKA